MSSQDFDSTEDPAARMEASGAAGQIQSLTEVDREVIAGDRDFIRLMITLTTATVVFAGTFVGDIVGDDKIGEGSRWVLYASWIVLILSTLIGLVAHGRLSQILIDAYYDPEESGLVWTLRLQQIGLLAGLILFSTFAALELPS